MQQERTAEMEAYTDSLRTLGFLSYLAIHREMKRSGNERKKRESLITELQKSNDTNEKLIKLRRNLIVDKTTEILLIKSGSSIDAYV